MIRGTQVTVSAILLAACPIVLAQNVDAQNEAETGIRAVADRWTAAYIAGDKKGVLDVYSSDAWIMPNERPHLKGHGDIAARLDAVIGGPPFDIDIVIQEIQVIGDFAWAVAHYVITMLDESGAAGEREFGTGVTIYRKEADGRWRILRDIDNRRLPDEEPDP